MAISKKLSSQSPEQQIETGAEIKTGAENGLPAENGTPALPAPLPEFLVKLNADRANEDASLDTQAAALDAAFITAKKGFVEQNVAFNFAQVPETIAAAEAMKLANEAIEAFTKERKALVLARDEEDSKNTAKVDLCVKFGIELTKLEALIAASKDEKDTLKASFTTAFGKPTLHVKQGATGVDVTKKQAAKGGEDKAAGTGTKTAAAEADLLSLTHDELLAKYPTTKQDGTVDAGFLNGTVRGLINRLKLTKNSEGFYVPRETAKA